MKMKIDVEVIFRGLFPWIEIFRGEERLLPRGFTRWEKRQNARNQRAFESAQAEPEALKIKEEKNDNKMA